MDSMIAAAGRALAHGDPISALKRVALREDPAALALRGIALAQLGDMARARTLLRQASRKFGAREPLARARCVVAEAEVALASRELNWGDAALDAARQTLEEQGDEINAAHARYLTIRRLVLLGRVDEAKELIGALDPKTLPPALRAIHELILAGIALRRLRATDARRALIQAQAAATASGIAALMAEVEGVAQTLATPIARRLGSTGDKPLLLDDVARLIESKNLVVDACRYVVLAGDRMAMLATRPILFALIRQLAEAWPSDVPRDELIDRIFRTKRPDETHRARLRVEIGRARSALRQLADIQATPRGYAITALGKREVVVLAQAVEEEHAGVLALLADGESWSSSALALALGTSQRSMQRSLEALASAGKVEASGRGRAQRWMIPPVPGFATSLLLPLTLPIS